MAELIREILRELIVKLEGAVLDQAGEAHMVIDPATGNRLSLAAAVVNRVRLAGTVKTGCERIVFLVRAVHLGNFLYDLRS
jgi:hypothetical protein